MGKDTQSRKWTVEINNPLDYGFTHDHIKEIIAGMTSVIYWCMGDEIGECGTPHIHIYLCSRGGIRFSTLKNNFSQAHIEPAAGTSQQNRDYITKTGKWAKTKKSETTVPNTFEEFGEMPVERQGHRNDLDDLYGMIKDGLSDYQILEQMPESLLNLEKLDKVRQVLNQERFKNEFREMEVIYIYGDTGVGKTRGIMEKYGYSNVFRVTDYSHPFDNYHGQDVLIFEEFRSSFTIQDMLNYLDGYPLELPCRYNNKFACFTKVYIITNIPVSQQYTGVQIDYPSTWVAFLRRIKKVIRMSLDGIKSQDIVINKDGFYSMLDCDFNPFEKTPGSEQMNCGA